MPLHFLEPARALFIHFYSARLQADRLLCGGFDGLAGELSRWRKGGEFLLDHRGDLSAVTVPNGED